MAAEPRAEHPHRCTAGHRWQHAGPTAAACEIPAYDPVTGDLPFVVAAACPVCLGRQDLLVRELHPHYCNLCDGDWDHEGVCVDSLAAYCPWCFPKADSGPVPGARRGPHFHFCSECGQNWQHETGCSAPLRAALAECTGCTRPRAEEAGEQPVEAAPAEVALPRRTLRRRLEPFRVPVSIAAGVLVSLLLLFKGYAVLTGPTLDQASVAPPRQAAPPAPAPSAPVTVAPAPAAPERRAPAPIAPALSPPTREAARPPAPRPPKTVAAPDQSVAPTSRAARGASARVERRDPAPRSEPRPYPDVPSQPVVRAPFPVAKPAEEPRAVSPAPSAPPARAELAAQPAGTRPDMASTSGETGARATPAIVTMPAIPGAPSFGGLTGSSGRDRSLEGHPRRLTR